MSMRSLHELLRLAVGIAGAGAAKEAVRSAIGNLLSKESVASISQGERGQAKTVLEDSALTNARDFTHALASKPAIFGPSALSSISQGEREGPPGQAAYHQAGQKSPYQVQSFKAADLPVQAEAVQFSGFMDKYRESIRQEIFSQNKLTEEIRRLRVPIAEQVRGMSQKQREERLDKMGRLLSEKAVRRRLGRTDITKEDQLSESERAEQGENLSRASELQEQKKNPLSIGRDSFQRQAKDWAWKKFQGWMTPAAKSAPIAAEAAAGTTADVVATAVPEGAAAAGGLTEGIAAISGIAGPVGIAIGAITLLGGTLYKIIDAMQSFAFSTYEGSRDLARFNGAIATSFALYERQSLILAGRTAAATSGSTELLGSSLRDLRESWQPISEDIAIIKNICAAVAATALKIGVEILKINPNFIIGNFLLRKIANLLGQGQVNPPLLDALREIGKRGTNGNVNVKRPLGGNPGGKGPKP